MEAEFWHQRWAQGQIGFHQNHINPYLLRWWPTLSVAAEQQVFVPLCGKSLDLAWLAGQGARVLGVELSEQAVQAFFAEHQLQPEVARRGTFTVYRSESIELWCGDFFELRAADVAGCQALYDRAALIALPEDMRSRYVAHLGTILPEHCTGLLVTLIYDQSLIPGPPFSVSDEEVQRLLASGWQVEALETCDVLKESWKFVQKGVPSLEERVYRVQR